MQRKDRVLSLCETYYNKQSELTPKEALCLLAECYIEYCGVSLGLRTIAYDAASYWMTKLAESDDPLAIKAQERIFMKMIPFLYPDFTQNKDSLKSHDIAPIGIIEAINGMDELLNTTKDERLKIALATGFIHIMEYYKDV